MSKKNGDNSDFMSRRQDEQLEQLEERLTALYANAANELESKYTDFMAGFEKDDKAKRELVEQGKISEDEYTAWRKNTMLKSTQYTKAVESMTNVLVETDAAAMAAVNGKMPEVVAESYDFVQALGYEAAKESGLTTGTFQIYNAQTVQALIKDNPDMLPKPAVDIPEDKRWNKDRINRELTQGIVQGESIPQIATRLQQVTNMDRNAAIRNARTAMTGAENMGRYQSAEDLREQGIPVEEVWSATPDDRTRESHRLLDGTTRDESGYFGVGIIDTPLRFAGDPLGAPEEVYNCRCRTSIVLKGIDHSQDGDLYAEFMKQFEDGKDMIDGKEPEAESQHQEPEQKSIDEIQPELAPIGTDDLPPAEDLTSTDNLSSGETGVVQGEDISETWHRDKDKYEFEIDDAIAAQGFNGLPQVVSPEEFDKAVQESGFVAQRTYSAPDQETLDQYRNDLYKGDWYVNCGTGGAQYGQGMYCAADYTGTLSDGIKAEMEHYKELGDQRYGGKRTAEELEEAKIQAVHDRLPEDQWENGEKYLEAAKAGDWDEIDRLGEELWEYAGTIEEIEEGIGLQYREAENYVETLTLTPDAKIIDYQDAVKEFEEFKEERKEYDYDAAMRDAKQEVYKELNLSLRERADYITMVNLWNGPSSPTNTAKREALEQKYGTTAEAIDKKIREKYNEIAKNNIEDLGSFCALKGYDAINAGGHGESGSYTVILNRTKCIFRRDDK